MSTEKQLTDDLIKHVEQVANATYEVIAKLPDSEQWDLQAKLRKHAVDAVSTVGEALGSIDPRDRKWRLGQTHAALQALAGLIKLAHDAHETELDPVVMVEINKAMKHIQEMIDNLSAEKIQIWLSQNFPTYKDVNNEN